MLFSIFCHRAGFGDATCAGERVAGIVSARGLRPVIAPGAGPFCRGLQADCCELCLFTLFYLRSRFVPLSACPQVTGADLYAMDMEELREITPNRTLVERELLLKTVNDVKAASQVALRL